MKRKRISWKCPAGIMPGLLKPLRMFSLMCDNIETLHQSDSRVTGVATGYRDLDQMTSGFQKNDLIIIAARPSVGKTAFALNIAQNVATKTEENVAIFSLEMGADQLVSRMLCAEGNIDSQRLRTGKL